MRRSHFLFSPLGTASISANIKYANSKKVPHLFVFRAQAGIYESCLVSLHHDRIGQLRYGGQSLCKISYLKRCQAHVSAFSIRTTHWETILSGDSARHEGRFQQIGRGKVLEATIHLIPRSCLSRVREQKRFLLPGRRISRRGHSQN